MSDSMTMDRSFLERAFWPVAVVLALLLLLLLVLGYGPGGRNCAACEGVGTLTGIAAAPTAVAPATQPVPRTEPDGAISAPPTPDVAPVEAERAAAVADDRLVAPAPEVARIYFARDSDELPADAGDDLRAIVAYLDQVPDARVTVSGFHDPSGDPLYNQDLASRRAVAVRSALRQAGVDTGRIELVRPLVTAAGGPNWEARRVEVSVVAP